MSSLPLLHTVGTAPAAIKQSVALALAAAGLCTEVDLEGHQSNTLVLCLDAEDDAVLKPTFVSYDLRYVWTKLSTADECVEAVRTFLMGSSDPLAKRTTLRFVSTRDASKSCTFLSAVREGLSPDGGLFVLQHIPRMQPSQLAFLCNVKDLLYVEVAQTVLEMLVGAGIAPSVLYPQVLLAYSADNWSGKTDICPVDPILREDPNVTAAAAESHPQAGWAENFSVMELFHGPTAAFKDFALQLFPRYFQTAVEDARGHVDRWSPAYAKHATQQASASAHEQYVILAATSGDTGVAAVSGFVNAGGNAKVMVLYPQYGVSPVQKVQMLTFDDGKKIKVVGIDTDFDFCQRSVKAIFSDRDLAARLAARDPPVRLSSANSINWGRLIPQVVYYFWAYRQHVQRGNGLVSRRTANWRYGDAVDFVVPCGNFGNILGGYFAKKMGLPIRRLIVASNENDVLCEFIQTGRYDITHRKLSVTASPSIDILKASNVERLLFLLCDGDTSVVSSMMQSLETNGFFEISARMKETLAGTFAAGHCSEAECATTIHEVYELSHHRRLLDPHTAVAVHVARHLRETERLRNGADAAVDATPLIVASTAHWAKFPAAVLQAIHSEKFAPRPAAAVPEQVEQVREDYAQIVASAPHKTTEESFVAVHPSLAAALNKMQAHNVEPRTVDAELPSVKASLEAFACN